MTNILMVTFDDLNDWTSVLGGYAGNVYTPNFDRLAGQGTTFTNAFSATPLCNPSRSSTLTGIGPLTSGVLGNDQYLFDRVDPAQTLPAMLKTAGWSTVTAGKVFHDLPTSVADQIYDRVLVEQGTGESGEKVPGQVIWTAPTQDSGIYIGDPAELKDVQITEAVGAFLRDLKPNPDGPGLFLSVGITRPHVPHIAPQAFFDLYPLEDIVLPEVLPDDLDDIPGFADYFGNAAAFDRTRLAGEWPAFVQAYLAAVSFADSLLGKLLDALEASAIADDTMVVAWSDHGYHLGEKEHAGKYTLWEEAARSTLIIDAPGNDATAGRQVQNPVSLLDLYPTLLDYADVPKPDWAEGESLRELIETGNGDLLRGHAITSIQGSHSIRTAGWRYTVYEDRSEELYNLSIDPEAFVNLADDPAFAARKTALARRMGEQLDSQPFLQNRTDAPAVLDASGGRELVLIAGNDGDTLIGGAGDNTFLVRSPGVTIVEAADGGDDFVLARASYTLPENIERISFAATVAVDGQEVITGNAGANEMRVTTGRVTFHGAGGNDTLTGASGFDTFFGDAGEDALEGLGGNDTLDGGDGDDELRGGDARDVYRVSAGNDLILERRGGGYDRIDLAAWGGIGNTRITLRTNDAGVLIGLLLEEIDGTARTQVNGFTGSFEIEALSDATTTLLLVPGKATGTKAADTLIGSGGDDTLSGSDGADRLTGNAGADSLAGGLGDDTIGGGAGNDLLDGGAGVDTVDYQDAAVAVVVSLAVAARQPQATGGAGTDRLAGFEAIVGSAYADTLFGQNRGNRLAGAAGNDTLDGAGGDDTLVGGAGADELRGAAGRDRFVFSMADVGAAVDRIVDFTPDDLIDLTAIDTDPTTPGRDRARYDPNDPANSDVAINQVAGATRVTVLVAGDADAVTILIDGPVTLSASSFLL